MKSVRGNTIYTGKKVVENAHVCFDGDRISGVRKSAAGEVVGEFDVITPAFLDPHSHIGMMRSGEPSQEAEANEQMEAFLALPDALDSVQMDDPALAEAVEMGVLYSCVLPGSGNIVGGRTAVIRNYAQNTTKALVARAGIKAAFGYNPTSTSEWKGTRPSTRMGALSILRTRLTAVRQKLDKRKRKKGPAKLDVTLTAEEAVLAELLGGKTRLRAHVHKIDDIAALLRIVDEFGLKVTVEHAMGVHRPEIFSELKRRGIRVTYGPVDAFAYKVELKHESWRNLEHVIASGVEFGLMSDHPVTPSRQLLLGTRWLTRFGRTKQDAIEVLSRCNAEILGVTNLLGTLEKGRWASFVGWSGDPFDITSYPESVYAEGELVANR